MIDVLHADELVVVHHDGSTSEFTDVTYTLGGGIRVVTATGDEKSFPDFDVFTTYAVRSRAVPPEN